MFLVSVLALTGIGVSYAGFTDKVTVYGSVQVATVKFDVTGYTGTWVYKVYGGTSPPVNEIYVDYKGLTQTELQDKFPGSTIMLVSSATATPGPTPYDATFTFDNLFPCIQFAADVNTTIGTIPVKVQGITLTPLVGADWIRPLIDSGDIHVQLIDWRVVNGNLVGTTIVAGGQVHPTDNLEIILWVHIPQSNLYQGLSGSMQVTVSIQQWDDECGGHTAPEKTVSLPDGRIGAVFAHYGAYSYWGTTLSGIPGGYSISDGTFIDWCVNEETYIVPGLPYTVKLYSSYDASFFNDHPDWVGHWWYSWPCVNYIINHKPWANPTNAQKDKIQNAIWYFINSGYTGTDPDVWALINDALANGQFFVPLSGQLLAVMVYGDPVWQNGYTVQHTFIEIDP